MRKENISTVGQLTIGFIMMSISMIVLKVGQDIFGADAALIWAMGMLTFPSIGMVVNSITKIVNKSKSSQKNSSTSSLGTKKSKSKTKLGTKK